MNERKLFAFTETLIFTDDLFDIADDETLYAIQNALLANPLLGDVIKGTSGARKGRIGNPKSRSGKSGGFRFIYLYLPKNDRFYLLSIYSCQRASRVDNSKKDQSDLSPEQAEMLGEVVREIKRLYGED